MLGFLFGRGVDSTTVIPARQVTPVKSGFPLNSENHVSPSPEAREELIRALRETGRDGGRGLRMNPRDTSFDGVDDRDPAAPITDEEVVDAVKSVPCHY